MKQTFRLAPLVLALALVACGPSEAPQPAQDTAASEAAEKEKEKQAQELGAAFDKDYAEGKWERAAALGEELVQLHADSPVTARVRAQYEEAKTKSLEAREKTRLALLWDYQSVPVKNKRQLSAALYSKESVDTGGGSKHPVRLIFRDHPEWGRSSYLVLENGDFDCYGGCKVQVTLDGQQPRAMAASRPKTDEAIAMFIEDEAALWKHARNAKVMTIEFPVKAGGKRTAIFETGGLDASKMPRW